MIVSINKNNSERYSNRFRDASIDLQEYFTNLFNNNYDDNTASILKNFLIKVEPNIINKLGLGDVEAYEGINLKNQEYLTIIEEILANIYKENEKQLISTLNEYFCYITDLTRTIKKDKYFILPIDEEPFYIDANTRMITIPAGIKKNGLAVQGDHGAEMVHFEINRYFDNIDLASNNIKIYIQYETSYIVKDINNEEEQWFKQGYVPAAFKDTETNPEKVIFGWLLDEYITKAPGAIKFAVHFLKGELNSDDVLENIDYKLSTLIAQSSINKTLSTEKIKLYPVKDPSQLIKDRLVDTELQEGLPAEAPKFYHNLGENDVNYYDLKNLPDFEGIEKSIVVTRDPYTGKMEADKDVVTLKVLAGSNDAGFVTYEWKKIPEGEADKVSLGIGEIRLKDVEEDTIIAGKSYYTSGGTYVSAPNEEKIQEYFDKKNYYDITENYIGTYYAKATNRLGTKTKDFSSNKVIIPPPSQPVINETEQYKHIVQKTDGNFDKLEVKAIAGNVPYDGASPDDLTYQWQKITDNQHIFNIEEIKNMAEEGSIEDLGSETTSGEYEINNNITNENLGWYTVKVIANRNGGKKEIPSEVYYRVSEQPSELEIEGEKYFYTAVLFPNEDDFNNGKYFIEKDGEYINPTEPFDIEGEDYFIRSYRSVRKNISKGDSIEVTVDTNEKNSDSYNITWYVDKKEEYVDDENDSDIISEFEGFYNLPAEALKANSRDLVGKMIYCRISNIFNGVERIGAPSYRFDINDSDTE